MDSLIKQFNLPKYVKGKSFAEASKIINSKFEGMDDKISNDTKNELLQRLADAQEYMKQQSQPQPQAQPNMNMPPEMNSFMRGGYSDTNDYFLGGLFSAIGGAGAGAGAAGGALGGALGAAGKAGGLGKVLGSVGGMAQGAMQNANTQSTDPVSSGLSGALSGAASGAALGPVGAIGGALVGGISSIVGANAAKKAQLRKEKEETQMNSNKILNDFRDGGPMNGEDEIDYAKATPIKPVYDDTLTPFGIKDVASLKLDNRLAKTPGYNPEVEINPILGDLGMGNPEQSSSPDNRSFFKKIGDTLKGEDEKLRYAPVAMNAFQLMDMEKPETERLDRLDNTYMKQYVDEASLQNVIRNQHGNTARALADATGGSTSALRANLLAANLNKTKALSDAYMRASEINRGQNDMAQKFDLGVDQANIGQSNTEKDINARNRAAYDNNKSKLLSQIGNDLGDIGMEAYRRKYPELMGLDYDADGNIIIKKKAGRNNKSKG